MAQREFFDYRNSLAKTNNNTIVPQKNSSVDNVGEHKTNDQPAESKLSEWCLSMSPFLYGLLIGTLACGLILAVISALWLTSSTSVSFPAATVSLPSKCSLYKTINDTTRLATAPTGSTCDGSIFSTNITTVRFSGAGGTELVRTVPNINMCGTQATGWYNGSMPSVGVSINGTVCFNWGGSTCTWSKTVLVTNCDTYYLYDLVAPPVCNLRYCTV